MMLSADKVLSVLGVVFIALALGIKAVPSTYGIFVGARVYRLDSRCFWIVLAIGLGLVAVAILRIIARKSTV